MRKLVGFYNYTVILTYVGFCFGVCGIIFACGWQNTFAAVICLLIAGLCDAFDGKIARTKQRTMQEQRFGIQIDSLSDVVCFGILPAMIGYSAGMASWWCVAIMVIYALCALIRLAYYNVSEEERQDVESGIRKHYLGLPVTVSAIVVPFIYLVMRVITCINEYTYIVLSIGLLAMAAAFIVPFSVKKPGKVGFIVLLSLGILVGIILLILHFA